MVHVKPQATGPRIDERDRVIVTGVVLETDERADVDDSLLELEKLVDTLGGQVVGRLVQARHKIDPATFIGSGKVETLVELVKETEADWVAFDGDLSPAQNKNLAEAVGVPVMDRCCVILELFSRRARTSVARMQVDLAHMNYLLPRLKHQVGHFSRQRGGIGLRGLGEKQLELDRRTIRKRIRILERKLAKVETQRATQRQDRVDLFKIAIVGYTNSGKSTLMRALTKQDVLIEDKLFSTLDAKVANFTPLLKPPILITDTVGFIRKLPHGLIESFRSTLQESVSADLLLHVVDLSDPRYEKHIKVGNEVLEELGLARRPKILVFNKLDRLGESKLGAILTSVYGNSVAVSAEVGDGLDKLTKQIMAFFDRSLEETTIEFDYGNSHLISRLYDTARVEAVQYLEGRVQVRLKATRAGCERLARLQQSCRDGLAGERAVAEFGTVHGVHLEDEVSLTDDDDDDNALDDELDDELDDDADDAAADDEGGGS